MTKLFLVLCVLSILNTSCTQRSSSDVNNEIILKEDTNLKDEYWAEFILPADNLKSEYYQFALKYANWQYNYDLDPDKVVGLIKDIDTKLFGGEPINGTLIITNDSIKYEPQSVYKLLFNGIEYYEFPVSVIVSAEVIESDALFKKKRLMIHTKNGSLTVLRCRKNLADFHLSSGYEEKIRDIINQLVAK
jgi:hypothetical protein